MEMLVQSPNRTPETPVTQGRVRLPVQTESKLFGGWGIRF
jgi:hypothetical protein